MKEFLARKNIVISAKRYGIDALGAMAQGLFCSLLIGTILNTIGTQFHIGFLTAQVITINGVGYTAGGLASFMSGPAMAVAIGYALQAPPLVLFSLVTVGYACNALGGAMIQEAPSPARMVTMGVTRMSTLVSLLTAFPTSAAMMATNSTARGPPAPPRALQA